MSHVARRTLPYGQTPGQLTRGGAEEEREETEWVDGDGRQMSKSHLLRCLLFSFHTILDY